ncbi:MAG: methyltransferase domain-containing protein [Myxococcales bacterium]|nr:methyltransferase domain-containing protein [Myxococcales bacterium]
MLHAELPDYICLPDPFSTDFYERFAREIDVYFAYAFSMSTSHFLVELAAERGVELRSIVDMGCGSGWTAIDLARRGYRVTGLDLSQNMLDLGRSRAEVVSATVAWIRGDFCDFDLDQPVDLAVCLGESVGYLHTPARFVTHLQTVARNLKSGGLYVAQFSFPIFHWATVDCDIRPPFVVFSGFEPIARTARGTVDGVEVEFDAYGDIVHYDPASQICQSHLRVVRHEPSGPVVHEQLEAHRIYHPAEVDALARLSDCFEPVGWYADFFLDAPLAGRPDSPCFISVLRRR